MSEFWFNALQSYAAFALLFGAAVLMIDFLADKLGIGGPRFPPMMFVRRCCSGLPLWAC